MKHSAARHRVPGGLVLPACVAACLVGGVLLLGGCNKDTESSRTSTTKTTTTPDGTKKTTETTEKKVETEHKEPR